MKKFGLVLTLSLVLAAGLTCAPRLAVAQGHHHRGFHGGAVFVSRPFFPHHHFLFHRPFFLGFGLVGPIVPFGVVTAAPVVVYSSPAVVYTPPPVVYTQPQVAYSSPPPAPAVPPMPTVIQYPHGRYELRGDGVTTPYAWVWIPNPPPPPPAPATPPAEPQSVPAPAPARGQVYSWTDAQGVTTWTNRVDKTSDGARAKAKRLQAAGS